MHTCRRRRDGQLGRGEHGKEVAVGSGQARQWLADRAALHLHEDRPGRKLGEWDRPRNLGFPSREIKPQNLWLQKSCGTWDGGRNSQPHRTVRWRDPQVPRIYTNLPTWESEPEGSNLLVDSGRNNWKLAERSTSGIVLSDSHPHAGTQLSKLGCPIMVNN